MRTLAIIVMIVLICLAVPAESQEIGDSQPITINNLDRLELGYALPYSCNAFSPDSKYIALNLGDVVYEIASGKMVLATRGRYGNFSPDGKYLYADHDGVYDVSSGILLFETTETMQEYTYGHFSPDSQTIAISNYGVYDLSGQLKFDFKGIGVFSPDGKLLATADGVYETATWKRIFVIRGLRDSAFSPDGKSLAIEGDGVYDTSTWEYQFGFEGNSQGTDRFVFSPNSAFLAVRNNGVYDLTNGKLLLKTTRYHAAFSADSHYLSLEEGVFDTSTWEILFTPVNVGEFTPDGRLYSAYQYWEWEQEQGLYDVAAGERLTDFAGVFNPDGSLLAVKVVVDGYPQSCCLLYGVSGYTWPYRSGLVSAVSPISLFDAPNGIRTKTVSGHLVVWAKTPDGAWLQVGSTLWASASDLEIITLPDGIPVEEQ